MSEDFLTMYVLPPIKLSRVGTWRSSSMFFAMSLHKGISHFSFIETLYVPIAVIVSTCSLRSHPRSHALSWIQFNANQSTRYRNTPDCTCSLIVNHWPNTPYNFSCVVNMVYIFTTLECCYYSLVQIYCSSNMRTKNYLWFKTIVCPLNIVLRNFSFLKQSVK